VGKTKTNPFHTENRYFSKLPDASSGKLLAFESRTTPIIYAIVNSADCFVNKNKKSLKTWI